MKGDFSRQTFNARKRYSGVLMQMGRVQTDADWNEQGALIRYRDETEASDVIGACGAPKNQAGFRISSDGKTLAVGAGRYYVDGLLCENDDDKLTFDNQTKGDLPNASVADAMKRMAQAKTSFGLVYLDVWQRHITAIDDPLIQEKALGGPDTTTRIKTVWQVKIEPLAAAADPSAERRRELQNRVNELQAKIDQLASEATELTNNIERVQEEMAVLPATDPRRRRLTQILKDLQTRLKQNESDAEAARTELERVKLELSQLPQAGRPTCASGLDALQKRLATSATLNARTQPGQQQDDPCLLPPSAGYQRLENQLYRVEVHQGGTIGKATFKWSRDNGTVVSEIKKISGKDVTVQDIGRDSTLGFEAGQWVELSDDALELNGQPGQLLQIESVDAANRIVTLKSAPSPLAGGASGIDPARRPKLRRWDQSGTTATASGVTTAKTFMPLEDGIEVQFGGSSVNTGDYWLIPARTANGEIEWPPFDAPNTNPIAQPPLGIQHHYCALALIEVKNEKIEVVEDCRRIFPPLTEISGASVRAMRVLGTNFANDDVLSMNEFLRAGLRITLDTPPDPASINETSVMVTAEAPFVLSGKPQPNMRQIVILQGDVGVDPGDAKTIVWKFRQPETRPEPIPLPRVFGLTRARATRASAARAAGTISLTAAAAVDATRLRVTLKGATIWSLDQRELLYLDGQSMGRPATRADNQGSRTALVFPTGNGARASDFESWFYVSERTTRPPLQINSAVFMTATGRESSAGTISFPRTDTQPVRVAVREEVIGFVLSFNRPVKLDAGANRIAPVFVELIASASDVRRLAVALEQQSDAQLLVRMRDPATFVKGAYRITALGDEQPGAAPIVAADDGSRLDGDYDNKAGGNFTLDVVSG